MKLEDLLNEPLPECCKKNKHSASFRTQEDYAIMYPNLTPEQLFNLTERMSETYPGTVQRRQVVDFFTQLNGEQ